MDKKHLISIFLFIVLLFIIYFKSIGSTSRVAKEHFSQLETYYFKDENNKLKSRSQHITKYNKSDEGKYTLYKFDQKESLIYITLDEKDFNIRLYFKINTLNVKRVLISHKNFVINIKRDNKLEFNGQPLPTERLKVNTQYELIVNYPLQILFFNGNPIVNSTSEIWNSNPYTDFKGIYPDNLDNQLLIGNFAETDTQINFNGYIGGIKIVHGTEVDKKISPDLDESQAPTVEKIAEKQQQAAEAAAAVYGGDSAGSNGSGSNDSGRSPRSSARIAAIIAARSAANSTLYNWSPTTISELDIDEELTRLKKFNSDFF